MKSSVSNWPGLKYFTDPKRPIIVLSPHYDDAVLSIGGWLDQLALAKHQPQIWIIFSQTNYLHYRPDSWFKYWPGYTAAISAKRLKEELAAQAVLGIGSKQIKCLGFKDAILRPKPKTLFTPEELSLAIKTNNTYFKLLRQLIRPLLTQANDIFCPLGIGGHVDHLLINQAVLSEFHSGRPARVFLYRDLPYATLTEYQAWPAKALTELTDRSLTYKSIITDINLIKKLKSAICYNSQITTDWLQAIIKEAYRLKANQSTESIIYLH